jgi:hypothetical protein
MDSTFSLRSWIRTQGARAHSGWNRYFFADSALHSLCLYRIVFCLIVCLEAVFWLPYAEELFSTEGFHIRYSFFSAYMSPTDALVFCCLLVVTSFLAAIGYFTRMNLIFTLIGYALLHSVDSINEKAVESIVMVVLTVLIFSRCNALYSMDVFIGRVRRQEKGCIFFQRLLQWEFAQIYFFCGMTKLMVPEWPTGKVMLDSLTGRWASDLGVWVATWIPDWTLRAFGFGTIVFELFVGPMLLTKALRWLAVFLALSFHFGIECLLDIGSLGLHFMAADIFLFFNADRAAVFYTNLVPWLRRVAAPLFAKIPSLRPAASGENEVFG